MHKTKNALIKSVGGVGVLCFFKKLLWPCWATKKHFLNYVSHLWWWSFEHLLSAIEKKKGWPLWLVVFHTRSRMSLKAWAWSRSPAHIQLNCWENISISFHSKLDSLCPNLDSSGLKLPAYRRHGFQPCMYFFT